MIITCIKCSKKFEVNSELIPSEGRTIQCGSCNHIWFYKNNYIQNDILETKNKIDTEVKKIGNTEKFQPFKKELTQKDDFSTISKDDDKSKSNFTFLKFISLIIVMIISFIGIILILDTFKYPLFNLIPNLEFFLNSLFETLKDIELFVKDLVQL